MPLVGIQWCRQQLLSRCSVLRCCRRAGLQVGACLIPVFDNASGSPLHLLLSAYYACCRCLVLQTVRSATRCWSHPQACCSDGLGVGEECGERWVGCGFVLHLMMNRDGWLLRPMLLPTTSIPAARHARRLLCSSTAQCCSLHLQSHPSATALPVPCRMPHSKLSRMIAECVGAVQVSIVAGAAAGRGG